MTEGDRRADGAQSADAFAVAAHVRAEAAMHRNTIHLSIAHLAGMVARYIRNQPRRELPHIAQTPAMAEHLIKRHHAPRRRVTASTGHACRPEIGGGFAWFLRTG